MGSSYLMLLQNFKGRSTPRGEVIAFSMIQRVSLFKAKELRWQLQMKRC